MAIKPGDYGSHEYHLALNKKNLEKSDLTSKLLVAGVAAWGANRLVDKKIAADKALANSRPSGGYDVGRIPAPQPRAPREPSIAEDAKSERLRHERRAAINAINDKENAISDFDRFLEDDRLACKAIERKQEKEKEIEKRKQESAIAKGYATHDEHVTAMKSEAAKRDALDQRPFLGKKGRKRTLSNIRWFMLFSVPNFIGNVFMIGWAIVYWGAIISFVLLVALVFLAIAVS